MATHKQIELKNEIFFITFTCYRWLPLFQITDLYSCFNKWFKYLADNETSLLAYVIMPNHFHCVLFVDDSCTKSLNSLVGNGKRFLAYEVIKRLKLTKNHRLLKQLSEGVTSKERNKGKLHQVFKPSFDGKLCFNRKMVETKLDYIHRNPESLVLDYTKYPHSSVGFYFREETHDFLKDYKDFI